MADGGCSRSEPRPTEHRRRAWIDFDGPTSVEVPAQTPENGYGYVIVPFTVTIPADAEPGDHVGGVVASLLTGVGRRELPRTSSSSSASRRASTSPSTARRSPASTSRRRGDLQPGALFGPGSMEVTYTVPNTGNVRMAVEPSVDVAGPFGLLARAATVTGSTSSCPVAARDPDHGGPGRLAAGPRGRHRLGDRRGGARGRRPRRRHGHRDVHAVWAIPWVLIALLVLLIALLVLCVAPRAGAAAAGRRAASRSAPREAPGASDARRRATPPDTTSPCSGRRHPAVTLSERRWSAPSRVVPRTPSRSPSFTWRQRGSISVRAWPPDAVTEGNRSMNVKKSLAAVAVAVLAGGRRAGRAWPARPPRQTRGRDPGVASTGSTLGPLADQSAATQITSGTDAATADGHGRPWITLSRRTRPNTVRMPSSASRRPAYRRTSGRRSSSVRTPPARTPRTASTPPPAGRPPQQARGDRLPRPPSRGGTVQFPFMAVCRDGPVALPRSLPHDDHHPAPPSTGPPVSIPPWSSRRRRRPQARPPRRRSRRVGRRRPRPHRDGQPRPRPPAR